MQPIAHTVDAASSHLLAFAFMIVLMLVFGVGRIAKETKTSVKNWKSFLNFWMFAYVLLLGALMSVTTSMALVLLIDANGSPRGGLHPTIYDFNVRSAGRRVRFRVSFPQIHYWLRRK